MPYAKNKELEAPYIRWLRRLVIFLTVTMTVGFVLIIVMFAIRFREFDRKESIDFPAAIELPADIIPLAYTQGIGWYAIVTEGDKILIYDQATGELTNTIDIEN